MSCKNTVSKTSPVKHTPDTHTHTHTEFHHLEVRSHIGALTVVVVRVVIDVGVEDVWAQLCRFLFHVAAGVKDLLHVRCTPDGEASRAECVETLVFPLYIPPFHRGKLHPTCVHTQSVQHTDQQVFKSVPAHQKR